MFGHVWNWIKASNLFTSETTRRSYLKFYSGSIQQDLLIVVLKVLGCIFGQTFKLSNNEEGFFLEMNAWLVYLFVNKVDLVAFTITFHREQTENFDFNPLFPTWTNKKVKKSAAT